MAEKHDVPVETFSEGSIRFQHFHPSTPQQESAIEVALKKSCLNYAKIITK